MDIINNFFNSVFLLLISFTLIQLSFTNFYAQESKFDTSDSLKTNKVMSPNSPQAITDEIHFKNETGNAIITITDEGNDKGSITLPEMSTPPASSTYKLYNQGGNLMFNGTSLGSGGASEIDDLSDAKYDGSSLFIGEGAGAIDDGTTNKNVGVGIEALYFNSSGSNNTAYGPWALRSNTSGSRNVGIGISANFYNQTGINNTIIGYNAGRGGAVHSKSGNVFIGHQAGYNELGNDKLYIENSSSSNPLIWGDFFEDSLLINGNFHVTGNITVDGDTPGVTELNDLNDAKVNSTGSLFLGNGAGFYDADKFGNVGVGPAALYNNDGEYNTAIGVNAMVGTFGYPHTGSYNTAIGNVALYSNRNGAENTAVGYSALASNTGGVKNTAVGTQSLYSSTASQNTAIGFQAMYWNTSGYLNTAVGYQALYDNETGFENTSLGFLSLSNNKTGLRNTAIGHQALSGNTKGERNIGIGNWANFNNQEGNNNTIIGYNAGNGGTTHSKSGSVFIGYEAGYSETGDNKLYIENSNSTEPLIYGDFISDKVGINGKLGVGTTNPSDVVHIVGTAGQNGLRIQVGSSTKFRVFSNGGTSIGQNNSGGTPTDGLYVHGDLNYNAALTSVSDKRYKQNFEPITNTLDKLNEIRGVYYDWKINEFPERDFSDEKQIGVIAQEVEKVFPELVKTNADGYKSVDYVKLTPVLIEAVKTLSKQNSDLDNRLNKVESLIENQRFSKINK